MLWCFLRWFVLFGCMFTWVLDCLSCDVALCDFWIYFWVLALVVLFWWVVRVWVCCSDCDCALVIVAL